MNSTPRRLQGAILLVAGTTIGAGMLALPQTAHIFGWHSTLWLFLLIWGLMLISAFFLLEAVLWYPHGTNIITIARDTLGRGGHIISWGLYLFLLYALITAYLTGFAPIFQHFLDFFSLSLPLEMAGFPLIGIFIVARTLGVATLDKLNQAFFYIALFAFVILCSAAFFFFDSANLSFSEDLSHFPRVAALVSTAFGYHVIVPSLVHYTKKDRKILTKALFFGSVIPLVGYMVWITSLLAAIPPEQWSLHTESNSALLLVDLISSPLLDLVTEVFALLLIITSFLGVALSLFDVLKDGFNLEAETFYENIILFSVTLLPPLLALFYNPGIFITALELAGGIGVLGLLCFIPALIVAVGRKKYPDASYRTPGGRYLPWAVMAVSGVLMIAYGATV